MNLILNKNENNKFLFKKMCGIFFYITKSKIDQNLIDNSIKLLNHRGPDQYNYELIKIEEWNILLIHTRLKINGNDTLQPLTNAKKDVYLIINGEIFNYKEIAEKDHLGECYKSDCEVVLKLYERNKHSDDFKTNIFEKLNGQYSFVLLDVDKKRILVGRDHIGITPLYYGYSGEGTDMIFASELKLLTQEIIKGQSLIKDIKTFFPRNYMIISIESILKYNIYEWKDYYSFIEKEISRKQVLDDIKNKLEKSVSTRLKDLIENNVDFGVLVSGGLDSSLICSIIHKYMKDNNINKPIKTFSIGVNSTSVDLKYARYVSDYFKTKHHEYTFTLSEGVASLEKVIWHIETFDTTSVRASTPMYLLTEKIKKKYPNLKVLFSGEGSDELFLSYRYGMFAPSIDKFYEENKNLISNVHRFDCLRANKSCMANGIEVRVPFLDVNFVDYVMQIPVKYKMYNNKETIEKHILREAFRGYLPENVLWRIKEQFSDGVSAEDDADNKDEIPTNWIKYLQYWANNYNYKGEKIDNIYFEKCKENHLYTYLKPKTDEQLLYRQIFCKLFVNNYCKNTAEYTVKFWIPRWTETNDPSGRAYIN